MKLEKENIGYWYWTWGTGGTPLSGTTLSIAFSGHADVNQAIEESKKVKDKLIGEKYISIGGGNESGSFTKENIETLTKAINNGELAEYDGISYDIEEGQPGLEGLFATSFQAAKTNGLKVLVTVSHSAPYGITDAASLMKSFFTDENIDILSPQLYTTGEKTENDYDISQGVSWSEYQACKATVVPSIVNGSMYDSAKEYFSKEGITLGGYIQWGQTS